MGDRRSSDLQSVKSLVTEFQGYINTKDDNEAEDQSITSPRRRLEEYQIRMNDNEDKMKKIAALTTREEIEELDRKRSEREWRCYFLQKDLYLNRIELMERVEKLQKQTQGDDDNHNNSDADEASTKCNQVELFKKALKDRNWLLKRKISHIRSLHGLQADKNDVQDYFDDRSEEHTINYDRASDSIDASGSNNKHQRNNEASCNRKSSRASPNRAMPSSVKTEESIESVKLVSNMLAEMWEELKGKKIKLKQQKQEIIAIQESLTKERQKRERLQNELKQLRTSLAKEKGISVEESAARGNQKQEADMQPLLLNAENNSSIPDSSYVDQNAILQMQRKHLDLFKRLMDNSETRQNVFKTSIIKRVEEMETEIRKMVLHSDPGQHNCKEMISLKHKLHIANEIKNELQCIIEEKDKKIKIYENDLSKHMQKMFNTSVDVNELQTEIDEANMAIQQMQVTIDTQNEDINNYALYAKELTMQLKERDAERAIVEHLREELASKDKQLEILERNLTEADYEKKDLHQKIENLTGDLSRNASASSTDKSAIEKLKSELAIKDEQLELLHQELSRADDDNNDLNQKIDDLIDQLAAQASSSSVGKSKEDLSIAKFASELAEKDHQLEIMRGSLAEAHDQNRDLNQRMECLIDELAELASVSSIQKSAKDLEIEKLISELAKKDQQLEKMSMNLAEAVNEKKDLNQNIENLVDELAEHVSKNAIAKTAKDLELEKFRLQLSEEKSKQENLGETFSKTPQDSTVVLKNEAKDQIEADNAEEQKTSILQELTDSKFVNNELRKIVDEKDLENRSLTQRIFQLKKNIDDLETELNEEKARKIEDIKNHDSIFHCCNERECNKTVEKPQSLDKANKLLQHNGDDEISNSRFVIDELRKILDETELENRALTKRIFELKGDMQTLIHDFDEEKHSAAILNQKNERLKNEIQDNIEQLRAIVKNIQDTKATEDSEESAQLEDQSTSALIEYVEKTFSHYAKVMRDIENENSKLLKELEESNHQKKEADRKIEQEHTMNESYSAEVKRLQKKVGVFAEEYYKVGKQNSAYKEEIEDDQDKLTLIQNELQNTVKLKHALEKLNKETESKLTDMTALADDLKQQIEKDRTIAAEKDQASEEAQQMLQQLLAEKDQHITAMQDEMKNMESIHENEIARSKIIKQMKAQIGDIEGIIEERNNTIMNLKHENRSLTDCVDDLYDLLATCICETSVNKAVEKIKQEVGMKDDDFDHHDFACDFLPEEIIEYVTGVLPLAARNAKDKNNTGATETVTKKAMSTSCGDVAEENIQNATYEVCNEDSKTLLGARVNSNNANDSKEDCEHESFICEAVNLDMESKSETIRDTDNNVTYATDKAGRDILEDLKSSDEDDLSDHVILDTSGDAKTNEDGKFNCFENKHKNLVSSCFSDCSSSGISGIDSTETTAVVQTEMFIDDAETLKFAERVSIDSDVSLSSSKSMLQDDSEPTQEQPCNVLHTDKRINDASFSQKLLERRNEN